MNTLTSPSSHLSSNNRFDLGATIRDSIFYFDDLMGDHNDLPVSPNQDFTQETNQDSAMARLFDEVMFESQYNIQDPKREETINALLKSIDSFNSESPDSE